MACILIVLARPAYAVYPNSMAATGDSMTKAFNACTPTFRDCPALSWSVGTNSSVNSIYNRILSANPAIRGNNFNDARSGSVMSALPGQVTTAAGQRVEYVTILMGANDACASSEATMTSVASFRADFQSAIDILRARLPGARISVVSIPDVYWLWDLLHTNPDAVAAWRSLGVCQSMLARPGSLQRADEERRRRVRQRVVDFNDVLESVCVAYAQCRYDNDTGFNYRFRASEVSTVDYFHPSLSGQRKIAILQWGATWVF
jgi:lysophospholipase L1-like esterase